MRHNRLVLALLAALVLLARPIDARGESQERWFVIQLGGEQAGWAHEESIEGDDGRITTASTLTISLKRGGQELTIRVMTSFVETAGGEPILMSTTQDMGIMSLSERYEFMGDHVEQTSSQVGRETTRRLDWPDGEWMTPAQASAFIERQLDAGETSIQVTTLDPSAGVAPVTSMYTVVGPENVEVMGKTVPAVKWTVEQSMLPGVITTEFIDHRGDTLRSDVSFGGITMTMLASEKELALMEVSAPELMAQTFISPSRPIDNPREARRAEYRLTLNNGGAMSELPTSGAQRATSADGTTSVMLDLDRVAAAPASEIADERYWRASSNADSNDPEIRRLVDQALENVPLDDDALRAEVLRRFVHDYIDEKSLGVGFATASEVCRTREGDCSEHGVLLATMLRVADIPSRVVSGLIYVDQFAGGHQIFGYHMWTQALLEVDGALRWIDLDATLPTAQPFDATHIALSTSSLADGDVLNSMAALVGLLGTLEIEVVDAE